MQSIHIEGTEPRLIAANKKGHLSAMEKWPKAVRTMKRSVYA